LSTLKRHVQAMQIVRLPVQQLNQNCVNLLIAEPLENVSEQDVWGEMLSVLELEVDRKVIVFLLPLWISLHS